MTVTERMHLPVLRASSVDEQFTVVMPIMNSCSGEWEQVTLGSASTLSVAFGMKSTVEDEFNPQSVVEVTFWQFRVGASSSVKGDENKAAFERNDKKLKEQHISMLFKRVNRSLK